MRWINVQRTESLRGSVAIPGSKNSSLALIAAACLSDEPVALTGVPNISDIRILADIGAEIGLAITRNPVDGSLLVDPTGIDGTALDPRKSSAFRTAYYFVGALLAKFGKISLGYPGGDDFLHRPIDQHIKALKQMGAQFVFHESHYEVHAAKLTGANIFFDMITSGATINAMLAATRAEGRTMLRNAARDPEVTDTANLLNRMGAKISGAGTDTIRIDGVRQLHGCTHTVIPDRLIAGAFLIAAGVTGGSVTVRDIIPEHLEACIAKLTEVGVHIERGDNSLTAHADGRVRATRVRTGMYPGFPTDLQQPFTALLAARAPGRSIVSDRIFPNRFNHVAQLKRMGADIEVRSGVALIKGGRSLRGAYVHASDIRAGISLILAGLAADGRTSISGIEHFDRGYENAVDAFASLGAAVSLRESDDAGETSAFLM